MSPAMPLERFDLCVIGAGSAGLSIAAGAQQMGARVALIEKGLMGGDCLNYGCVPSKALLAAARRVAEAAHWPAFGLGGAAPAVDFAGVMRHVHEVIAAIAPNDSVERFEGLGVTVIQAEARFLAPDRVQAGGRIIAARRFVLATGSRPAAPPIPGLTEGGYLTNETVFALRERPRHLLVLGGGPIGCELAQAFRRLGSAVTLVELDRLLPKDDPELAQLVRERLLAEGVTLHEKSKAVAVAAGPRVTIEGPGGRQELAGSHLLLALGRRPDYGGLDLAAAGVELKDGRPVLDRGLRTTNRRIYAAGDAAGGLQFTHLAGAHAGIVIRRALFRLPARADRLVVPWVTYCDPELASVGQLGADAARHRVLRWSFHDNDRAQAERRTAGLIKVVTTKRGRVLGAAIAGPEAGELILPWVLAVAGRLKLAALASVVAPYPTLSEVSKRAAGSFYAPALFGSRTRRLVRWLLQLP
jgi:pyruvate/2-oxoglutarate dehydrogenase complex dihydrolipoamide dehydrogenase (E3) component